MLLDAVLSRLGVGKIHSIKCRNPCLLKCFGIRKILTCSIVNLALTTAFAYRTYSTSLLRLRSLGQYDLVVVGGGIVGCATARELKLRHPDLKMAIIEKENDVALHQSDLSNGVIHAGIYYKPGSLQAKLCVKGMELLYDYCNEKKIPYRKCGKLIVATNEKELEKLEDLYEYGLANSCPDIKMVDECEIRKIEPYCKGLKAVWSPNTGSVNYGLVTKQLSQDFVNEGGEMFYNFDVIGFDKNCSTETSEKYPVVIRSRNTLVEAGYVLTCAGLHSDKLAAMTGCSVEPKIIPFRIKLFQLREDKIFLIKTHICPVPDPRFPFFGAQFTPSVDGNVWVSSNTVLTFKRDGYSKWQNIDILDLFNLIKYPGFRKLVFKFWLPGMIQLSRTLSEYKLKKCIPYVETKDIVGGSTKVLAQAVMADGEFVNDFVFTTSETELSKRVIHFRSAPSPAATSSLAISKSIAEKVQNEFKLKT